jgi:hypothetical protein
MPRRWATFVALITVTSRSEIAIHLNNTKKSPDALSTRRLLIDNYFFGEAAGLAAVFASFLAPFSALAAFTSTFVAVIV